MASNDSVTACISGCDAMPSAICRSVHLRFAVRRSAKAIASAQAHVLSSGLTQQQCAIFAFGSSSPVVLSIYLDFVAEKVWSCHPNRALSRVS
jgi:hypothetical protein